MKEYVVFVEGAHCFVREVREIAFEGTEEQLEKFVSDMRRRGHNVIDWEEIA